jgi:hypothetical protein
MYVEPMIGVTQPRPAVVRPAHAKTVTPETASTPQRQCSRWQKRVPQLSFPPRYARSDPRHARQVISQSLLSFVLIVQQFTGQVVRSQNGTAAAIG